MIGIPKTIDNDIPFIGQSFGFVTAFSAAAKSINAAMVEARAAVGGVGLVKLMGRHSGFIACYAALANHEADFVLIPEVPFALDGPDRVPGGAAPAGGRTGQCGGRRGRGGRPGDPGRHRRHRRVGQRPARATSAST